MKITAVLMLSAVLAVPAHSAYYDIDSAHSSVGFKIRHMVVSKVSGSFGNFTGDFFFDPADTNSWKVKAVIDAASINTNNSKRDDHLRTEDFFDVKKYPTIEFTSTKVLEYKDGKGKVEGTLLMHGTSKPVVLDVELGGMGKGARGNDLAGFTATTKVSRKDFGIGGSQTLPGGGLAIGDDVDITIEIEGVSKEAAKPASEKSEKPAKKGKK